MLLAVPSEAKFVVNERNLASTNTTECECNINIPNNNNDDTKKEVDHTIRILQLRVKPTTGFAFMGLERTARQHYEDVGVKVEFDYITDKKLRSEELRVQLQNKLPLYDGFVLPSKLIVSHTCIYDGNIIHRILARCSDLIKNIPCLFFITYHTYLYFPPFPGHSNTVWWVYGSNRCC